MEDTIKEIFAIPKLDGCVVDFYPHIIQQYNTGGIIKNERDTIFNLQMYPVREEKYIEYIHREKKLIIYDSGDREYVSVQQKLHKITNGLYVVSKIDCIDPNKFPILNKYYDVKRKSTKIYDDKYITISIISEYDKDTVTPSSDDITYIKLSFVINYDDHYRRSIIRHLTEVISLLQNN